MNDEFQGIESAAYLPERTAINVNGRKEHEAIIKDPVKCKQLELDQMFETMVYLKRWGGWLKNEDKNEIQS